MIQPVLFASLMVVIPVLLCLGVVVVIIIKAQKGKFEVKMTQPSFTTGEDVTGTVSLKTGSEISAERAVVMLVGMYEERRRKARSTVGYDDTAEEEWDSYTDEAFRHEEDLAVELPIPKGFKGDIDFAFPAPRPEQVTVRTNVGGVLQGLDIREGELPGAGFAMLTWTLEVHLVGSDLEPVSKVVPIMLA